VRTSAFAYTGGLVFLGVAVGLIAYVPGGFNRAVGVQSSAGKVPTVTVASAEGGGVARLRLGSATRPLGAPRPPRRTERVSLLADVM